MKTFLQKTYKPFLKSVAFILAFVLTFSYVQEIFKLKGSQYGKYEYYSEEEENSMDIIYFGNSRCNRGIDPLIIDEVNGTYSYNMGIQGLRAKHVYIRMKDALSTQTPKLVVIETAIFTPSGSKKLEESYQQRALLPLPTSMFKLDAAIELGEDASKAVDLFLPLLRFHSRYEEVDSVDFLYLMDLNDEIDYEGRYTEESIIEHRGYSLYPNDSKLKKSYHKYCNIDYAAVTNVGSLDKETEEYLEKIVDLCKGIGAEILFLSIPAVDKDSNYETMMPINNYIREKYKDDSSINMLDTHLYYNDIGLDYMYYQNSNHLNRDGAVLFSNFFAQYLKDNYSTVIE